MQAAVYTEYGEPSVVSIADLPVPQPGKGDVRVQVSTTAVTAADARIRAATFPRGFAGLARLVFGIRSPRRHILGGVFAGEVAGLGTGITGFESGQRVCGMTGARLGAHAEYICVKASKVTLIPDAVSDEQAAGVLFGGTTALTYLRDKAKIAPGATVLINGGSGAIGTNAIQLARHFGGHVTAVTSTANVELVRNLGAEQVIDYTQTNLSDVGNRFDIVFDTVGNLSIESGRRLVADGGVLLLAVASLGQTLKARGNVKAGPAAEDPADYAFLLDLVAKGDLTAVIDSTYPFADIVAAHARVDTGHKVGNVIVSF